MTVPDESPRLKTNSQNTVDFPTPGNALASVIQKLKEKQVIQELSQKFMDQDLSEVQEENLQESVDNKVHNLLVEKIGSNNVAVFQTLLKNPAGKDAIKEEHMKSQVSYCYF